jgi:hypothetical protein
LARSTSARLQESPDPACSWRPSISHLSVRSLFRPCVSLTSVRLAFVYPFSVPTPTVPGVRASLIRPSSQSSDPVCPWRSYISRLQASSSSCPVWCSSGNGSRLTPATYHHPMYTTPLPLLNHPACRWRPRVTRSPAVLVLSPDPVCFWRSRVSRPPVSGSHCPVLSGVRQVPVDGSLP